MKEKNLLTLVFRAALPTTTRIYESNQILLKHWHIGQQSKSKSIKMGAYLSEPVTKKDISTDEDGNFWVSSASMQGWRVSQEVIK